MTLPATKRDVLLTASSETADLMQMIARASSDPAVDVVKFERLMELYERVEGRKAEEAFNEAMSTAQAEMEPVSKDAKGEKGMYASYAALDNALRPIYTKHGLSLSFNTATSEHESHIIVICYVTRGRHTRHYSINMPADGKGPRGNDVMTRTHATGSAVTYGMRYLLKMIFNVAVGSEGSDDDGKAAGRQRPSLPRPATESQFITQLQVQELLALLDYSPERLRQFRVKFLDGAPLEEMRAPAFEGWKRFIQDINAKRARQATGKPAERFYREKAPNMSSEPQDASTAKSGASWDVMDQDCNEKVDPDTGEVTAPPGPTQPPVDAAGNRAPTIQEWKDKERPTQRPKPPRPVPSAAPEPSSPRAPRDGSAAKSAAAPFPPSSADLPWEDQVNALVENAPDFSMTNINALMKWQQRLFELMPDKETAAETHWEHIRERLKDIPHPANADVLQGAWNLLMKRFD